MIASDQPTIFPAEVVTGVSSIEDGSMKFEWGDRDEIVKNSERFLAQFGIQMAQTVNLFISGASGWDKIRDVGKKHGGEGMTDQAERVTADVLVTNHTNVALFLPTADCYPIILYDRVNHVLALAHLGWQSTVKDVTTKTVEHMKAVYGSRPANLQVYIGPGIKQMSYRFDSADQLRDQAWVTYVQQFSDGTWGIDLLGYNVDALKNAGVMQPSIETALIDTATNPVYFSNFGSRELGKTGPEGRFATVAMMR